MQFSTMQKNINRASIEGERERERKERKKGYSK